MKLLNADVNLVFSTVRTYMLTKEKITVCVSHSLPAIIIIAMIAARSSQISGSMLMSDPLAPRTWIFMTPA